MVAILTVWILIFFISYSMGGASIHLYEKCCGQKQAYYSIPDIFFLGLCITGSLLTLASIWFPTNQYSFIVLFTFAVIYSFLRKNLFIDFFYKARLFFNNLSILSKLIILLSLGFILFTSIYYPPKLDDSCRYHIQSIMWNEQYHVVPGLANIFNHLGLDSSFLVLSAAFLFRSLFHQPIYAINSLCLIVFILWIIAVYNREKSILSKLGLILIFFPLISFTYWYFWNSSPATDCLVDLIILYLLLRVIVDRAALIDNLLFLVVALFYCITLKLSSIIMILLLLGPILNILKAKKYKDLLFLFSMATLILIPWLVRNTILTGSPIYPFPAADIFHFDWRVSHESIVAFKKIIYEYPRVPDNGHVSLLSYDRALNGHLKDWVPAWINSQALTLKILFYLSLLSPIAVLYSLFYRHKIKKNYLFYVWIVTFIASLFWFFTVPDFRFSYHILCILCFIPLFFWKEVAIGNNKILHIIEKPLLAIFIFAAFFFAGKLIYNNALYSHFPMTGRSRFSIFFRPKPIEAIILYDNASFTKKPLGDTGVMLSIPTKEDRCYDFPLPASPAYAPAFEMRGNSLQDGFRPKKNIK